MARRKNKRINPSDAITALGMGVGGGVAANQLTNLLEKQSFMAGKQQYAPLATLGVGIAGYIYAPDNFRNFFFGMTVASGTEQAEALISKATNTAAPTGTAASTMPRLSGGIGMTQPETVELS